ncbi:hypothetical protein DER45DRAFT_564046 [Fusarium avenaceum]|nr:hypothetical protein DER45DRAFT_564046 [Fusarium avenaceum]
MPIPRLNRYRFTCIAVLGYLSLVLAESITTFPLYSSIFPSETYRGIEFRHVSQISHSTHHPPKPPCLTSLANPSSLTKDTSLESEFAVTKRPLLNQPKCGPPPPKKAWLASSEEISLLIVSRRLH